ncbi:MAG: peptide deformylase [Acidimicrobiia bacterium]|nr:peptide deformylase [Acidimicrobiia bacterium]
MAIYPIRTFGDPVLRTRATSVDEITSTIGTLIDDMIETMYDAPGVGLAAPQIGVSKRVFVFDAGFGPRAVINPDPVDVTAEVAGRAEIPFELPDDPEDEWMFDEGCLSVPGYYWPIARPSLFGIRGVDERGDEVLHVGNELLGRVLQHEYDHLEGMLLLERLPTRARKKAMKELRKDTLGI